MAILLQEPKQVRVPHSPLPVPDLTVHPLPLPPHPVRETPKKNRDPPPVTSHQYFLACQWEKNPQMERKGKKNNPQQYNKWGPYEMVG